MCHIQKPSIVNDQVFTFYRLHLFTYVNNMFLCPIAIGCLFENQSREKQDLCQIDYFQSIQMDPFQGIIFVEEKRKEITKSTSKCISITQAPVQLNWMFTKALCLEPVYPSILCERTLWFHVSTFVCFVILLLLLRNVYSY